MAKQFMMECLEALEMSFDLFFTLLLENWLFQIFFFVCYVLIWGSTLVRVYLDDYCPEEHDKSSKPEEHDKSSKLVERK